MFTVLMYASQSWRYCFLDRVICLSMVFTIEDCPLTYAVPHEVSIAD